MPDDTIPPFNASEYYRNYRIANKEKIRKRKQEYNSRPEIKIRRANYQRQRHKIPEIRLQHTINTRNWRDRNPEKVELETIKKREQREAEQIAIAGRPRPDICDLCGQPSPKICFDHSHEHGHFRGWLCSRCNLILGLVKDDPILLEMLAAYLREPPPDASPPQPTLPRI